jgi:outer membrane receptor for ferrienterochelin and colicin
LRGDSGVTVLIDGKYPISSNFLQTLAASDIDRIEVMTNPSAQYEADGTGGIINIITKKRHPFGLSGTLVGHASSQGQISGNTSLSLTQGPWSVTGRLSAGTFPGLYRSASTETSPDIVHSHQRTDYGSRFSNGELEVARKIGDHQTVTLNAAYYPNWSRLEETDEANDGGQEQLGADRVHLRRQ